MEQIDIARRKIINFLWDKFKREVPEANLVASRLASIGAPCLLDHMAIMDLPGPRGGIAALQEIFSLLDYKVDGADYLAIKKAPFVWMSVKDAGKCDPATVSPLLVLGEFRLSEFDPQIAAVITRIASSQKPAPLEEMRSLAAQAKAGSAAAGDKLADAVTSFLVTPPSEKITKEEIELILQNRHHDVISRVLVFGNEVNHFGLSIHLANKWKSLEEFNDFISNSGEIILGQMGGRLITGSVKEGLQQSATQARWSPIALPGGETDFPNKFIEFDWRARLRGEAGTPACWEDFHQGFFAMNAR